MRLRHVLSLAALPVACTLPAFAQSTATITGVVTDPTGAVIAHAHVTVHSLATGQDRKLDSDSAGIYVVPSLEPGDYSVRAEAAGFSAFVIGKVTLDVDRNVTVNMKLPVESAGETVQVEETGTLIEAQTITVGQVIDARTVQELPLNGRHFLDLTVLTPGGVVAPTAGSLTGASRGLGANSFITAGNREDSVNFQINGVNLNDLAQNQITFQPSISTTSEFKIDNSTFSAEYGRSSGSIVNVSTRSGTNKLHGEVFDYFRNEALDARNFFDRPNSVSTGASLGVAGEKAPLKRNNFGVSVGGPIIHDHTFFFASYEGLRQHQGLLQNSLVFTTGQRNYITQQNNPSAIALLALVPLPNSSTNSYVAFTPGPVQIDQGTMDLMHIISNKDQIHSFYAFQRDQRTEPALQGDTVPGFGDHRLAHRQVLTLNETHIFNSNLVNDARIGFNRINIAFTPNVLTNPQSLGIGTAPTSTAGIPQTTFSDIGLVIGGPSGFPQGRVDTLGLINDTVTLIRGKHTIKAGGEARRFLEASFAQDTGTLTFATSIGMNTPATPTAPANNTLNIFALGNASGFTQTPANIVSRVYVNAVNAFVQDNYKLTPRFTAELGFRYEWNGTPTEGANRFYIFNPTTVTLQQTNTNGVGGAYNQNFNYEPRVGFAWDILGTTKTVLRGGYAILADQPVANAVTGLTSNPPATNRVSFVGTAATAMPVSTIYQTSLAAGIALADVNRRFSAAYTETYNVNVQQDFGLGLVGSVGYYGSVGKHLRIATNENQPVGLAQVRPFTTLAANSEYAAGRSIAANITEANSTAYSMYNGLWTTLGKTFRHGLQFNVNYTWTKSMDINSLGSQGGLNLEDSNNPNLNYGLSDFDVRNHFAGTAIYAFPKHGENRLLNGYRMETIIQYQTGNPVNIVASSDNFNGVTGVVRPNQLRPATIAKVYTPGITNVTYIASPGGTTYGGTICDTGNTTPACVFQVQATQSTAMTAGPTGPLTVAAYNGLGNLHRNSITGPGFADVDVTGEKETKITERLAFTLRADAFDILNHPNFGQPSGNVQSTAFGQISATRFAISDGGSSRQLQISGKFTF